MAKEGADQSCLRELAHQESEAVRAGANRAEGRLQAWLERVIEDVEN